MKPAYGPGPASIGDVGARNSPFPRCMLSPGRVLKSHNSFRAGSCNVDPWSDDASDESAMRSGMPMVRGRTRRDQANGAAPPPGD
jgi:hypothetical protein